MRAHGGVWRQEAKRELEAQTSRLNDEVQQLKDTEAWLERREAKLKGFEAAARKLDESTVPRRGPSEAWAADGDQGSHSDGGLSPLPSPDSMPPIDSPLPWSDGGYGSDGVEDMSTLTLPPHLADALRALHPGPRASRSRRSSTAARRDDQPRRPKPTRRRPSRSSHKHGGGAGTDSDDRDGGTSLGGYTSATSYMSSRRRRYREPKSKPAAAAAAAGGAPAVQPVPPPMPFPYMYPPHAMPYYGMAPPMWPNMYGAPPAGQGPPQAPGANGYVETDLADVEREWANRRARGARPASRPGAGIGRAPAAATYDTRIAQWNAQRHTEAARTAVAQHATWLNQFRRQVNSHYQASANRVTQSSSAHRRVDRDTNSSLAGLLSPRHERYRHSSPRATAAALNFAAEV